jgi:hypothetical protein
MKYLILIALFSLNAHADDWFCNSESSMRDGNVISVCGIGTHKDEAQARAWAMYNARNEFKAICNSSSDCIGHFFSMDPKRTECVQNGGIFRCVRMLAYTVGGLAPYVAKVQKSVAQTEYEKEQEENRKEIREFMVRGY